MPYVHRNFNLTPLFENTADAITIPWCGWQFGHMYCTSVTCRTNKGTYRMNTKWLCCSSDFFTVCPNFVQHNQGVQPTKSPICLKFVSHDQGFVWCSSNPYATFGETRQRSGCSNFYNCVQVRPIITNLGPRLPKTFSRTLFHSCVKCVKAIQW